MVAELCQWKILNPQSIYLLVILSWLYSYRLNIFFSVVMILSAFLKITI